VEGVGYTDALPLGLGESDNGVQIPGYAPAKNEDMQVYVAQVMPGYFEAMGIPVVSGRTVTPQDDSAAAPVMVVNQAFANRFWRGQSAIGKTVHTGGKDRTVVGVVPTGKYVRLGESPAPFMWMPVAQVWDAGLTVVVHVKGDPAAFIPTLRAEVRALDANMPLSSVKSLNEYLGIALLPARLAGTVLGIFGVLGLLLASVGVYGVMSYSVSQRTREIGIRMAIGASQGDVITLIMRQGLTLVVVGSVIGLAGAFGASRFLRSVLYGGQSLDALTFLAVPLLLVVVAAFATWLPSRRAAALDPMIALRQE
jgi:predicted permease